MQSTTSFNELKDRVGRNYSTNEEDYSEWMLSVKATLGILRRRSWQMSIYKVPDNLRRHKEDAYVPHIVSIGPYHRGKHELRAMEEQKWQYMLDFLRRASVETSDQQELADSEETALNKCGEVVSNLEEEARACYAERINLDKHQLVEVLLIDGCFILELLIKHAEEMIMSKHEPERQLDPIINNFWMVPNLQHDLALLENQIPFSVLQKLFKLVQENSSLPFSLNKYVLLFFRCALNLTDKAVDSISNSVSAKHKHLLDMLHYVYKPTIYPIRNLKGPEVALEFQKCATQLFRSGVQFQVGDQGSNLLDITFIDGVMTIPPLFINKPTNSIFRNLIAFEQCSFASSHHMSAYAILMSSLIRSPKDAQLLGPEIFDIEGGEDVSVFLSSIQKEVVFRDFYFAGLCEEVKEYHRFPLQWGRVKAYFKVMSDEWSESLKDLKQSYFQSRWSLISFLAASLVILLTILQTVYSVLSYYPT